MNDTLSETQLLQASVAGSKDAFGAIVRRYQALVCAVTYSATGDAGTSEELAQETFLRAWRNLRQLDDPGKFRAWLCKIARNLAHTSLRANCKAAARPLERGGLPAAGPEPDEAALAKERQEVVWAAVERVPLQYREPLVLFYRRQQSVREVAADLGLSEQTVRQRLHRGRQLIKGEVSSLVENTLTRSGPGQAFAIAVVAALPALGTQTAAAGVAAVVAKGTPAAKMVLGVGLGSATLGSIIGLLGGILGWVGGWLGGILGTRAGIRRAKSPRERRFVIRISLLIWLLAILLGALPQILFFVGVIPMWAYWSCWGAFFVILLPLVFWSNARQQRIQIEDGTYRSPEPPSPGAGQSGPRQSLVGLTFGPLIWVLIVAAVTGDWITAVVVFALGFVVLFITRRVCATRPERPSLTLLIALLAVGAVDLGVVCLRWRAWQQNALFNKFGGVVPFWIVALVIVGFVAAGALVAVMKDRRRPTPPTHPPDAGHASRSGGLGALAGAVFGSTAWLAMMTQVAGDHAALTVVVIYALVVFLISAGICAGRPHRLWPVLLADIAALYVLHMVVLNLRWNRWMAFFEHAGRRAGYHELSLTLVDLIVTAIAVAMALFYAGKWAADRQRRRQK